MISTNRPVFLTAFIAFSGLATSIVLGAIALDRSLSSLEAGFAIGGAATFVVFALSSLALHQKNRRKNQKPNEVPLVRIVKEYNLTQIKTKKALEKLKKELSLWQNHASQKRDEFIKANKLVESFKYNDTIKVIEDILEKIEDESVLEGNLHIDIAKDDRGEIQSVSVSERDAPSQPSWYIHFLVSNPIQKVKGAAAALITKAVFESRKIQEELRKENHDEQCAVKLTSLTLAMKFYDYLGFITDPLRGGTDKILTGDKLNQFWQKYSPSVVGL